MTRIVSIEARHYRIPLPVVMSDSTHGEISHSGLIVARIRDADGAEGVGYTYTVNDIGSRAIHALIEYDLAPPLIGEDARNIDRLWERMWWHVHFCGRGGATAFAIAAIDIALWDLEGRRRGEPLWRMLGGHRRKVPAYAGGIDLYFTLDALREQTRGFLARGFGAIKMKVGRDRLAEDVERVAAVRELVGPDFPLMADANMRWQAHEAIRAARALAPFSLVWLEEPVIPDDVDGLARVAVEGGVPIATGENLHSVHEFEQTIARGRVSFSEPDAATLGGITPWMQVARLAEARNLPVTSHGIHDIHVHLLGAVPNGSWLEFHGFGLERFLAEPLRLEDGCAIAPNRPGHGVEFDFDALDAHRVRT
ncbi:MAG: mandelate racemase/muconate lactonizing enzyme family protein [Thiotrichales bacterium]|nr:mandelate racemase/muconate lactonizing enzyme family protein [Thiotrichales bacterium]